MSDTVEVYQPANSVDYQRGSGAPAAPSFDLIVRQADVLAQSSIVPRRYQGKPGDIIAASLMGAELGWQPMTSMRLIHIIEGTPEISAKGMAGLIRRAGHSLTGETSADKAVARGKRRDNGDEMEFEFTQADANRAKLTGKENWRKYPGSMLWARALGQLSRMLFSDVTMGFYVEGEISGGDLELGEPAAPPPLAAPSFPADDGSGPPEKAFNGPTVYADEAEVDELLELVNALGDDDKAALKAEAARRGTRPGQCWSFQSFHHWLPLEVRDCKAWVESRHGTEPWDTDVAEPPPAGVDAETGEITGRHRDDVTDGDDTGRPGEEDYPPPPLGDSNRDRINRRLFFELDRHGITDDQRHDFASVALDTEVASFSDLTETQMAALVAELADAEPGTVWTAPEPEAAS